MECEDINLIHLAHDGGHRYWVVENSTVSRTVLKKCYFPFMYACMYVCVYVCMYVCVYVYMYLCMYYVIMYVCMCVCIWVCVYAYITYYMLKIAIVPFQETLIP